MSRLDSFIRRMQAQRSCLNLAAQMINTLDGPVLELGLGNGRTFDHLREILPNREIFVFDQKITAHPSCIPDPDHLFLGDIHETLPQAIKRFGKTAALVHSDIGSNDTEENRELARYLSSQLHQVLRPGGLVVSDQKMTLPNATPIQLPDDVSPNRYFMISIH